MNNNNPVTNKMKIYLNMFSAFIKNRIGSEIRNSSVVTPKGRRLDSHTSFWLSNPTCAGCHRRKSKFLILVFELWTKNISSCWNVESNPLLISNYF